MLADSPVVAVVAVSDMEGAATFYGETLGLRPSEMEEPGGVLYDCGGGTRLLVYQSGFAGKNEATAASWQVEDIEGEIEALKAKGITFEQYDMPASSGKATSTSWAACGPPGSRIRRETSSTSSDRG